jgi:stage III sporulation protein AE
MKRLVVGILAVLGVIFFPLVCYAEEEEYDYGQDIIQEALPDQAQSILEQNDITVDNYGVLQLTPIGVLNQLWDTFQQEVTKPLKMLLGLLGVVLLCALAETFRDSSGSSQAGRTFDMVAILAGTGMMSGYITQAVLSAKDTLVGGGQFLLAYIPTYAGILAVNGQVTSATVFHSVLIIAAQLFTQITVVVLVPLSGCILGLSIAGAVNPELKIQRVSEGLSKIVIWTLGLLMTVFVGLLSVQNFVTSAADSVTMKAAKFAVSSAVPFVGGAVSDALSTVKGGMSLLKNGVGTFGIVACAAIILPTLLSVLCYRIALMLGGMISDLFGVSRLSAILKSGENIMSIVLAMLCAFFLMITISTMLVLGTGMGVV